MNPKTYKDIVKITAEKVNLPESLVTDIVKNYYKTSTKRMGSLEHLRYKFPGLGTFFVVRKRLERRTQKQEKIVDMLFSKHSPSMSRYEYRLSQKVLLEKFRTLKKKLEEYNELRAYFKEHKKMGNLITIWKNKGKILEGIKNNIFRNEHIEDIANQRLEICKECNSWDTDGKSCVIPGTAPCCKECGCKMSFKARSLSAECDLGKWDSILTEDEEDLLNENLNKE